MRPPKCNPDWDAWCCNEGTPETATRPGAPPSHNKMQFQIIYEDVQDYYTFQKQIGIFQNSKKSMAKKSSAGPRYYKKIGLGKYF